MIFKLPYWVANGGDGSAIVRFTKTLKQAERRCDAQDEGWGENSAGEVIFKVVNGELFLKSYRYVNNKYENFWMPIPQTQEDIEAVEGDDEDD